MNSSGVQEFFRPGGGLGPEHPSYIDRAADNELYSKLVHGECTCILNARQMGKTSLKNAAKERLASRGILLLSADLSSIGGQLAPEQWYCSLLQELTLGLKSYEIHPTKSVRAFWLENQHWAPAYRFFRGIEELLLRPTLVESGKFPETLGKTSITEDSNDRSRKARLILAIDEIDKVRDFEGVWSDDFFGGIRGFYESRESNLQSSVGFLLIGVAPPSELTKGPNSTPFNIGHRIALTDFSRQEATKLEKGFTLIGQSPERAAKLLDAVMGYTGGHPYLTQRLCYQTALMIGRQTKEGSTGREFRPSRLIDAACRECFLDPGIGNNSSDDNLRNVHIQLTKCLEDDRYVISHLPERPGNNANLEEKPSTVGSHEERKAAVLKLYALVLRGKRVRDDFRSNPWVGYLHFAGIVRSDRGQLKVRNRLYEEVFNRRWVLENMPGSFRRAEMAAFVRGLATATSFALLVFVSGAQIYKDRHQRRVTEADRDLRAAQVAIQHSDQVSSGKALIKKASKYHLNPKLLTDTFIDALSRDSLTRMEPLAASLPPPFRAWNGATIRHLDLSLAGFPLRWLDFSLDGKYVAAIYQDNQTCLLTVKRVSDGSAIIAGTPCCHAAVAFDPSGERVAFASTDGTIKVVGIRDGQLQRTKQIGSPEDPLKPHRLQFNPNPQKRWLAMASSTRDEVLVWDVDSDKTPNSFRPPEAMAIRDLAWDTQGNQLAVIGEKSSHVVIWDFRLDAANPIVHRFNSTANELDSIEFLPGGRTLAGIGPEGFLFLWQTDGSLIDKIEVEDAGSHSRIVRLQDGTVGLGSTNLMQAWSFEPSTVLRSFPVAVKPHDEIVSFEMDPSGSLLLVAGSSWLTLFDATEGETSATISVGGKLNVQDAIFTPNEGDLLVSGEEGVLWWKHQLSPAAAEMSHVFKYMGPLKRPRGITAAAVSADQSQMALAHSSTGFQDLHIDLIDIKNAAWQGLPAATNWNRWLGEKLEAKSRREVVTQIKKLLFSPDQGRLLGYSSESGKLLAWTLTRDGVSKPDPKIFEETFGSAFSPDGRWLVTAERATNRCWSLQKGEFKEVFRFSRPYRIKLGAALAIAPLPNADEFLLAQPTASDSVQLLLLTPNAQNRVQELAELALPGRAKIIGLRISEHASILAALTEHDGNYAIQLWNLNRMNQLLRDEKWAAPLSLSLGVLEQTPRPVKVKFEPERLGRLDMVRDGSFYFVRLENELRALRSQTSFENIKPGTEEARLTRELLNRIANTSALLGEADWERYFRERARMLDASDKL